MSKYREETTDQNFIVRINEDGSESWIPTDPSNSDYQRYLCWLEDPTAEESGTL